MSYATGYSYLFVRCKNAKQCEYHKCYTYFSDHPHNQCADFGDTDDTEHGVSNEGGVLKNLTKHSV